VKVAELETILVAQDIADEAQLFCLSCRRRLACLRLADEHSDDGSPLTTVAMAQLSEHLRDFQKTDRSVGLACGCGKRSLYHLI
jgi:hypothetical protein